jgi:hypothetical protein
VPWVPLALRLVVQGLTENNQNLKIRL